MEHIKGVSSVCAGLIFFCSAPALTQAQSADPGVTHETAGIMLTWRDDQNAGERWHTHPGPGGEPSQDSEEPSQDSHRADEEPSPPPQASRPTGNPPATRPPDDDEQGSRWSTNRPDAGDAQQPRPAGLEDLLDEDGRPIGSEWEGPAPD